MFLGNVWHIEFSFPCSAAFPRTHPAFKIWEKHMRSLKIQWRFSCSSESFGNGLLNLAPDDHRGSEKIWTLIFDHIYIYIYIMLKAVVVSEVPSCLGHKLPWTSEDFWATPMCTSLYQSYCTYVLNISRISSPQSFAKNKWQTNQSSLWRTTTSQVWHWWPRVAPKIWGSSWQPANDWKFGGASSHWFRGPFGWCWMLAI